MNRIAAALVAISLAASACGVSRDSDDVVASPDPATEESTDGETAADESAASDGAEDGSEEAPATTLAPLPESTPPTTGAPDSVALTADFDGSTVELTHGDLNDIVVPTVENEQFTLLVFGGARPPGFEANVLSEQLVSGLIGSELETRGVEVSDDELETSKDTLLAQVVGLFAGADDAEAQADALYEEVPYLPFLALFQARQDKLTEALAAEAEGEGTDGVPCVRHILLESEADAQAVLDELNDGGDFGELAVERSTGPSGPNGGELGCAPSDNYVEEFRDAVNTATVGEVVGPVETQFGFHVLIVDGLEVDARSMAADLLQERLGAAQVDVDPALGMWNPGQLTVVPTS